MSRIRQSLVFFLLLIGIAGTARAQTWSADDFSVEMGTVVHQGAGLTLEPNEQGQVLLGIPGATIALSSGQRAHFTFLGPPPPKIYLIWRRSDSEQLFQLSFATHGNSRPTFDLATVADWRGQSESLQLGFRLEPGTSLTLVDVRLAAPGIRERVAEALHSWRAFRPWAPADINVLTGTLTFNEGPYPAQVFAFFILLLLLAYLAWRRSRARWTAVATIILCAWVALDALWQWRLWQQLGVTRAKYAGLGSSQKIQVSESNKVANLAMRATRAIEGPDPRVFIASQSDREGMLAAYYMAPHNTYWHRRGDELPENRFLRPGDYILAVNPSTILYDRSDGLLRLPPGDAINVIERFANNKGLLLEVAP